MWDILSGLQLALLDAVEEHRILCSADVPDRTALSASRWRIAQAGRVRMDYLTGTVFPAIDAAYQDAPVRFAALRNATTPYQRDVSAYVARWPTEAILTQWSAYQRAAQPFRAAILARVSEEANVLRPILDRMPAVDCVTGDDLRQRSM